MADLHLMLYLNGAHSMKSLELLGQDSCVCAESSGAGAGERVCCAQAF